MNRYLLLLFFLVLASCKTSLQNRAYKQEDKGHSNKAIQLFKKLLNEDKAMEEVWYWRIARCYQQKKDTLNAMNFYEKCTLMPKNNKISWSGDPVQRMSHHALSDFYMQKKDFEKALTHLRFADSFPRYFPCGAGYLDYKIREALRYAKCFEAASQVDSAIKVLSEYMFYTKDRGSFFMLHSDYQGFVNYSIKLLLKKHSHSAIQNELKKCKDHFVFSTTPNNNVSDMKQCIVYSYIDFFDNRIVFADYVEKSDCNNLILGEEFRLNLFINSILYKQFMSQ